MADSSARLFLASEMARMLGSSSSLATSGPNLFCIKAWILSRVLRSTVKCLTASGDNSGDEVGLPSEAETLDELVS